VNDRSPLERRLIALALLVLAAAVIGFGVIAPLAGGFAARADQRERLTDDLIRGRRLLAERGFWRAEALRQRADADRFDVIAPSASAAAQLVGDRISAAVQTPGGVLSSLREQPSGSGEARLRLEARLTLTQLVATLTLLQGQRPYLIIEGLSIAADPRSTAGQSSPMDVRIDLGVPYRVTVG
jgi:general secretion pathway protein M